MSAAVVVFDVAGDEAADQRCGDGRSAGDHDAELAEEVDVDQQREEVTVKPVIMTETLLCVAWAIEAGHRLPEASRR